MEGPLTYTSSLGEGVLILEDTNTNVPVPRKKQLNGASKPIWFYFLPPKDIYCLAFSMNQGSRFHHIDRQLSGNAIARKFTAGCLKGI